MLETLFANPCHSASVDSPCFGCMASVERRGRKCYDTRRIPRSPGLTIGRSIKGESLVKSLPICALFGCAALLGPLSAAAEDDRFELGLRGLIILGDGRPANDMLGASVAGRFRWKDGWYLGVGLDSVTFDYERPYDVLGISSTEEVDGTNDFRRVSGWIERRYDRDGRSWSWFWAAGLGLASVDAEIVRGSTLAGGTYDIATDAKDEVHVMLSAGIRRAAGARWALDGTLGLEHHSVDYQLTDRISGATGAIGSQTPLSLSIGISRRF